MKKIHLIGLNHKTATVEIREKFALADFTKPEAWPFAKLQTRKETLESDLDNVANKDYNNYNKRKSVCRHAISNESQKTDQVYSSHDTLNKLAVYEALILSTCNRVEVLAIYDGSAEDIIEVWSATRGYSPDDLRPYLYCYEGHEAIAHLFRVASSLDSLVLGEPQILGQLKAAYRLAVEAKHAGLMINKILHKSFSVAKRVRTETGVASNAVSISYAAVELAKRIFDDMDQHTALLVGAGEMAELAAMHLMAHGVSHLYIVNRTFARASELAGRIGGEALVFEALENCLQSADIVISSTGSNEPIINAQMMREVMKKRKNRPMFLIDIAMPRDIDPDVNNLDSVYVYDIDDLKEVVEENLAQRKDEARKALAIVADETDAFELWRGSLALKPTILEIEAKGHNIADIELHRTLKQLEKIGISSDLVEEAISKMAHAIVRKCHHAPLDYLSKSYRDNHDTESVDIVRQVLNLDYKDNTHESV